MTKTKQMIIMACGNIIRKMENAKTSAAETLLDCSTDIQNIADAYLAAQIADDRSASVQSTDKGGLLFVVENDFAILLRSKVAAELNGEVRNELHICALADAIKIMVETE